MRRMQELAALDRAILDWQRRPGRPTAPRFAQPAVDTFIEGPVSRLVELGGCENAAAVDLVQFVASRVPSSTRIADFHDLIASRDRLAEPSEHLGIAWGAPFAPPGRVRRV